MARSSTGILLYRRGDAGLEVLLAHPGGPLWARREAGAWSVPKGELDPGEDELAAARREFQEELGSSPPSEAEPLDLGEVRLRSGKLVRAFALEGDLDVTKVTSNLVEVVVRGRSMMVPEVDRAGWFSLAAAAEKLNPAQVPFLERLATALRYA